MHFTHRDDPSRSATLHLTQEDPPTFTVEHTDAKGKTRKKGFKNAMKGRAYDAGLRFLLNKEGYVLRTQESGPVRWMARLLHSNHGGMSHDVDPVSGVVWVGDGDRLHGVEPGTCETRTIALGTGMDHPAVRVQAGADSGAWLRATSYRREGDAVVPIHRLMRVRADDDAPGVTLVAALEGNDVIRTITSSTDGHVLGPSAKGAALYGPDGAPLREWSAEARTTETGEVAAVAAISPSAGWVALGQPGAMRRVDLEKDIEDRLSAEMNSIGDLQVCDDGQVFASGFCYPSHGLFRLDSDGVERVSQDLHATVSADGSRLVEVQHRRLALRDARAPSEDPMQIKRVIAQLDVPMLGMAKRARAVFGPGETVTILSDAYTVACVDLSQLS